MRLILEKFTRFDPDRFSLILRLENTLDTRAIRYCDEYMIWSKIKRLFGI